MVRALRRPLSELDLEVAVFHEVNEHMRSTETKALSLALTYLSVFGIGASILANRDSASVLFEPSSESFVFYLLLYGFGLSVVAMLRWYRAWKEHYIVTANSIVERWKVDGLPRPVWLQYSHDSAGRVGIRQAIGSPDELLTTVIAGVTGAAGVLLSRSAISIYAMPWDLFVVSITLALASVLLWYCYVIWTRRGVQQA